VSQRYTSEFFRDQSDGSRRSAKEIVPLVLELIRPKSVIDVGCGVGTWLSVFRECGVDDVVGVDGDYVDRTKLEIPEDRFLPFDLTQPFRLERHFDLVVSLEVAEHLPADCGETFVDSLTRLGPVVLFSAAIPSQGGTGHVNEQWPDYWADRFRKHDHFVVDCLRKQVWQNDDIEHWYAQNTLLFVRQDRLERDSLLEKAFEQTARSQLSLVHPKQYLQEVKWTHALYATARELAETIAPGETFVLVDDEQLGSAVAGGYRTLPFLERDGEYWGPPPDDDTAIDELERLRRQGASFLVFAWPAFWWLEHYAELARHVRSRFTCLLESEWLVVFDLRP
jgi:SAM-dependent methyltransferase